MRWVVVVLSSCSLCMALAAHAGPFPNPDFQEEPFVFSTFWSVGIPLLTSVGVSEESDGVDSTVDGSQDSSEWSQADEKLLLDARADAAVFVASAGAERSAMLDAALRLLGQQASAAHYTEQQLAMRLLVQGY